MSRVAAPPVDLELVRKHNRPGPRYTSYPTALQFRDDADAQRLVAAASAERGGLSLYFHLPFCESLCWFCGCNKVITTDNSRAEVYLDALVREMDLFPRDVVAGRQVVQLHFGGGTPNFLTPAQILRLGAEIKKRFTFAGDAECSVELDPRFLTRDHARAFREIGMTRASFGIQDVNPDVQRAVHRVQSDECNEQAFAWLRGEGFESVNVDLIYGLPGQTPDGFRRDIERAAAAGVSSLCLYSLRLNVHTPVATSVVPGERFDLARLVGWRRFVHRAATELGFVRTRPYFFEREGASTLPAQSPDEPLLGIGMSARSQLGDVVFRNLGRSAGYVERVDGGDSPVETLFRLGEGDLQASFVAGTLGNGRLLRRDAWDRRFGGTLDKAFGERLQALRDGGLLADAGESVRLTEDGLAVYDRVVLGFYPKSRQEALRELPPPRPAADEGVIP